MPHFLTRREILRKLGIGSAAMPLLWNLPSLCEGSAGSESWASRPSRCLACEGFHGGWEMRHWVSPGRSGHTIWVARPELQAKGVFVVIGAINQ